MLGASKRWRICKSSISKRFEGKGWKRNKLYASKTTTKLERTPEIVMFYFLFNGSLKTRNGSPITLNSRENSWKRRQEVVGYGNHQHGYNIMYQGWFRKLESASFLYKLNFWQHIVSVLHMYFLTHAEKRSDEKNMNCYPYMSCIIVLDIETIHSLRSSVTDDKQTETKTYFS